MRSGGWGRNCDTFGRDVNALAGTYSLMTSRDMYISPGRLPSARSVCEEVFMPLSRGPSSSLTFLTSPELSTQLDYQHIRPSSTQ